MLLPPLSPPISPLVAHLPTSCASPRYVPSPALTRSRRDLVRRWRAGAVRQHPLPGAQTSTLTLTPTLTLTRALTLTRYQLHDGGHGDYFPEATDEGFRRHRLRHRARRRLRACAYTHSSRHLTPHTSHHTRPHATRPAPHATLHTPHSLRARCTREDKTRAAAQLPSAHASTHTSTHLRAPTGRKAPACPLGGATVLPRSRAAFACLIIPASRHSKYPRIVYSSLSTFHAVDSWSLVARHVIARWGSRSACCAVISDLESSLRQHR